MDGDLSPLFEPVLQALNLAERVIDTEMIVLWVSCTYWIGLNVPTCSSIDAGGLHTSFHLQYKWVHISDPCNNNTFPSCEARPEIPIEPASQPPALTPSHPIGREHLPWPTPPDPVFLNYRTDPRRRCSLQLLHPPTLAHHPGCSPQTALL